MDTHDARGTAITEYATCVMEYHGSIAPREVTDERSPCSP